MECVAAEEPFGELLAEVAFPGEMLGRIEHGVVQLAEFDLQITLVHDLEGVFDGIGDLGEARLHLVGAAQIKLFRHIARAHALRIAEHGLGADADQAIVGVRVAFLDVMNVVGRDAFQAEILGENEEFAIHLGLFGDAVVL